MKIIKNKWFTIIEIIISILILTIVFISWFQALSSVTIWKSRVIQQTDIQKEAFYFSQKLFEMIKKWWVIDYEEYFNRKIIWSNTFSSGHFSEPSWFWNFWRWWVVWTTTYWSGFYYCISPDWWNIGTWWCVSWNNLLSDIPNNLNPEASFSSDNFSWEQQRYWQYSFQFIDYNSNSDFDNWDENWDSFIIWDDDDEYIGNWPIVFTWWTNVTELYLISWDKTKRTFFRWNVKLDPEAPPSYSCSVDSNTNTITWSWCLWTIEYLSLEWQDYWMDHDILSNSESQNDWVIDTWTIDYNFTWVNWIIAWTWTNSYWVPLFPETINVTKFEVYPYPNKSIEYAWRDDSVDLNISPYVDIVLKIKPSWISRKKIGWEWKEIDFSMTVSLTDIYSN